MSLHSDLLEQAKHLARREPKRPKQASLRRAVSAAYYALFHLLTDEASRLFVKNDAILSRLRRTYAHSDMNKVSKSFSTGRLPARLNAVVSVSTKLRNVAQTFVDLQQARHEADYNLARSFTRSEAVALIAQVEQAFQDWNDEKREDCARLYLGCFLLWSTWEKIH